MREAIRKLNCYVVPAWSHRRVASIDKRDVAELLGKIADRAVRR